jgi:hypothetical protein
MKSTATAHPFAQQHRLEEEELASFVFGSKTKQITNLGKIPKPRIATLVIFTLNNNHRSGCALFSCLILLPAKMFLGTGSGGPIF